MVKSSVSYEIVSQRATARESRWPYEEYYLGSKDGEDRRNGEGENHWTGAESIEWHVGRYFRDTMHGYGDYRWRYKDRDEVFVTYEGRFYANQMHGYGVMSYPDGRVFSGIFYKDVRWGPGEERLPCLRSNVGLWRGTQLARLVWRPAAHSVAPDFTTGPKGASFLDPYRIVLRKNIKIIGQTNSAIELLKQCGAEPKLANDKWRKLYSNDCTDLKSIMCHKDMFENEYYKGKIKSLEEERDDNVAENTSQDSDEDKDIMAYFSWNNSEMITHMMKHCYQHDGQKPIKLNLTNILSGPRRKFRPASKHEYDCRTLLMACYLGHISNVAQLINEEDVYSDVADIQGNTALVYATCGDQSSIIHFLVEAGANVDSYNDSCCTPLGIALIRFLCVAKDIIPNAMVQALLPPVAIKADKASPQEERRATEWQIKRELTAPNTDTNLVRNPSKTHRSPSMRKVRSQISNLTGPSPINKKKIEVNITKPTRDEQEYDSEDDTFAEERRQFITIRQEYAIKVNNIFESPPGLPKIDAYLFDVNDMIKDIEADEAEHNKTNEKNPKKTLSIKTMKDMKSKEIIWQNNDRNSFASMEKLKTELLVPNKLPLLSKIHETIIQLLSDGADPKLVRCPQPALLIAVKSGNADLVRNIIAHGADVNESFPEIHDYTALDVAISEPFRQDNIEMITLLLQVGADVQHRLRYEAHSSVDGSGELPGPTLLHALLAKKVDFEFEEDIRNQIIRLLLQYNCDPCAHFNGRSPIDIALTKNQNLIEIFVNNPGINLNAVINSRNQTILVKMFSRDYLRETAGSERFHVLTELLLRGADPLLECFNDDTKYGNLFEFAKKVLNEIAPLPKEPLINEGAEKGKNTKGKNGKGKNDKDAKGKVGKDKSTGASVTRRKSIGRGNDEVSEYRQALDLITECARLLHIRWLQAKLVKELVDVIYRYKHRPWNMIIKEHKNSNNVGLWLTAPRCLEIWDLLKTTQKKRYTDDKILRHLLCIVRFYQKRLKDKLIITPAVQTLERNFVESDIGNVLKEYKIASKLDKEMEACKKYYVKPELAYKNDKKFRVCFECSLPLPEDCIVCYMCQMLSFCNRDCMSSNLCRAISHPCSDFLRAKYFPPPPEDQDED